ncbi:hypothetical protein BGP77_10835 [Saccharospirillum sp. MSK14-1]|uniref:sensor histidine kinase n=1 Tax=Saccharospirillum sp. MSK14-1 TaxID=1897632 RepID=UPI000D37FCC5|nr:ATP-binding protein [Saccharospirillum sp. MSK14-1]PTY38670.1 hypothetical protein BGP77_10835 [Saccharospirillum sp. MSK14-1]
MTLPASSSERLSRHLTLPRLPFWLASAFILAMLLLLLSDRWLMRQQLQQSADDALQRLGAYRTSLQATIDRHLYLPRILASDPRIVRALRNQPLADPLDEHLQTSDLLAEINRQAGSDQIYLMDTQGLTHWSSNHRTPTSFVGNNYGYRPYFRQAISGQTGFYFAVGATSGKPGLFLSAPVSDSGDQLVGVVVVKIDLEPLEQSWAESGDAVWVTDREGIIFLSSSPRWHYRATRPLSDEHRIRLAQTRQYGTEPVQPLTEVEDTSLASWAVFDLADAGRQVAFAADLANFPWQMHLRLPLASIQHQVRLKQFLALLLCAAAAGGALYYRERHRRSAAQQALVRLTAEREHHQRAIIQNSDAGLLNLDTRFEVLFVNEPARQFFHLDDDESALRPEQLIQPWQPEMAGHGPCRAEGIRRDGSRFPLLYTLNPIRFEQHDEYILTVQDITELTAAQQALQDANAELEARVEARTHDLQQAQAALAQNQKLAALGRMSAAIAHEINQPITALGNYTASSRLLLQRGRHEDVDGNLGRIEGLVDRLSRLSRQLRVFAGKRNSGSAPVSIQAPVLYALDVLAARFDDSAVHCELDIDPQWRVQANAMALEQILVNLLANALDALRDHNDGRVHIQLQHTDNHDWPLQLSIQDNGPGLDNDSQGRVFEPFYSTKDSGDGLGLGLAISYSLAQDLGADLSVHSELGVGTRFVLAFPATSLIDPEHLS